MALLICCATRQELSALVPDIFPVPEKIPEMQPIIAPLGGNETVFVVTGTGPVNASIGVGYCLGVTHETKLKISRILCAGLAYSFNLEQTPLLSIWRVDKEVWPEYGLNDGIRVTARAFSTPLWKRADDEDIYNSIQLANFEEFKIASNAAAMDWLGCASLTVAGVTASFARRDTLWNYWHIPLENMEGFAVAFAALRAGIPCLEIRVVAAKAGPRSREEKDIEGALAKMKSFLSDLKLR